MPPLNSTKVSPKVPTGNYKIAEINYELNVLATRGPRKMKWIMSWIPMSSLEPGGNVPGQPELLPYTLDDSFRSISSKSIFNSSEFGSSRFFDKVGTGNEEEGKDRPIILKNKSPRWHEQL
jgi:hypothetical protein